MRTRDLSKVLALSLALAAPHGVALAQGTASHQVSVSIPTVLRLRLDDGAASDRASVDVAVSVAGDRVRIDPGTTRVEVRANADWALDVRYRAAPEGPAVPLGATLDGTTWHRLAGGARLATGSATDGWRPFEVTYGLLQPLLDGTYHGTVVYTLTQP
jgi:hypothetical protein